MAIGDVKSDRTDSGEVTKPSRSVVAILKRIIMIIGTLIVAFIGFVAIQPSDFRVARTTTIAAPTPVVFAQVNDFHNWSEWSPWAKLDPAARSTFEGPSAGEGARFRWVGNDEIGEGSMIITESRPSELIRIKIDFLKPFQATNTAEFAFQSQGDHSTVTWSMSGSNNFMAKVCCLFMNMDKMLGGEFEKGLTQMKLVAEAARKD